MTGPNEDKKGLVGFGKPPKDHQFKKGRTGNPRGRPPKDKSAKLRAVAHTQHEDILLFEGLRPIQIRENDQVVEMPMIQAVVRIMGVAAVKGNARAQATVTAMFQAVQAKRKEELLQLFKMVVEYKAEWDGVFAECDLRRQPRPEPIPHPDDLALDFNAMDVKFNGPMSSEEKAKWDHMLAFKAANLQEIAECRELMKTDKENRAEYEEEIRYAQNMIDIVDGVMPDEETRRAPGFDLLNWRKQKGVLEVLEKRRRRLRTGAKSLPTPF